MLARRLTCRNVRWLNAHPLARLPDLLIIRCVEHQHVNPAATLGKVWREGTNLIHLAQQHSDTRCPYNGGTVV